MIKQTMIYPPGTLLESTYREKGQKTKEHRLYLYLETITQEFLGTGNNWTYHRLWDIAAEDVMVVDIQTGLARSLVPL